MLKLVERDPLVVNLSSHELTQAEVMLLRKGFTFCPTPGQPDILEIKSDFSRLHTRMRQMQFFATRSQSPHMMEHQLSDPPNEGFEHKDSKKKSKWSPVGPIGLETFIAANNCKLLHSKEYKRPKDNFSQGKGQPFSLLNRSPQKSFSSQLIKVLSWWS